MEDLQDNMSEKSKRLLQLSTEKGVSNRLPYYLLLSIVLSSQSKTFGILSD